MKKTHWLRNTLITLLICGMVGLILSVVLFFKVDPSRISASSSVEFTFNGAAEGIAPNGLRYDLGAFVSDEVLNAALSDTSFSEKYTASQLKADLIISGVYPKDIVNQMTGYESLISGDASKVAIADFHATLYKVTLYNDFDPGISQADLERILAAIMTNFQVRFKQVYALTLSSDSVFLENLSDYDYPQQLELLEESIDRYSAFAEQMAEEHADFLLNGEGFADIAAKYTMLKSGDLDRISGLVTMNALSKDQERIVAQYENRIRQIDNELVNLSQEAKDTEKLINSYAKDDIIMVVTSETLRSVNGNITKTYDELVTRKQEIEDSIADKNKELTEVKLKLRDITGDAKAGDEAAGVLTDDAEQNGNDIESGELTEEILTLSEEEKQVLIATVEKNIAAFLNKLKALTSQFRTFLQAYTDQEMNGSTIAITAVKYDAPRLLSGNFIKYAIKTTGPFCALGLMVCLVGIIISRRKEEKQ